MINKAVVWFRNDLRVHDNEALTEAIRMADEIIPIFVFDDRVFNSETTYGFAKTGRHRVKFIYESVLDLQRKLQELGSNLIIKYGNTEEIIFEIAKNAKVSWVFCNRERTDEEVKVQDTLEKLLWTRGQEMRYSRGKMLYYTADLPFPVTHSPDTFTSFRKEVEKFVRVRVPLAAPNKLPALDDSLDIGVMPSLAEIGGEVDSVRVNAFNGGETAALKQLNYYLWESDHISQYKKTRNEMLGWDFSSKMSPYLAQGCISPKMIYAELKRYEAERTKNDSTYWLGFELLWRDYFRLIGKKFGNKIFQEEGTSGEKGEHQWSTDQTLLNIWTQGRTGIPMVDANMKELNKTGFMSNRGRQNVASFLVNDMKVHWLMGAEYFESMLIDYDPCSNYGNWNYIAGVGVDPRPDRWFNVVHQGKRYDTNGDFIRHWLPQLGAISGCKIHEVPLMSKEQLVDYNIIVGKDYPNPIVRDKRWR